MIFFDTCALLDLNFEKFNNKFAISSITLQELENIKTSYNKDNEVKFKARSVVRYLKEHEDKFNIVLCGSKEENYILNNKKLQLNNDNLIVACACNYQNIVDELYFCTTDLLCEFIAKTVFNLKTIDVNSLYTDKEEYIGYKNVVLTEKQIANFYENVEFNHFNCLPNQYVIINDLQGNVIDVNKWTGNRYSVLINKNLKTTMFDKIKPKDNYQKMVIDSILTNTMTAISGKAGSGKSLLSLYTAMYLIESGKYDRLVILTNPIKTAMAADIGYYSGDMVEKLMQNSIGNILTTKFGDKFIVDTLLQNGKLKLVSMADVRGMEIKDNEILYITECQNTNSELLKLCLSRASQGCKIIIEGDYDAQVDSFNFQGGNNGMKRVIDLLKGNELFGFVKLKNIYRSKIANLVDKL